MKNLYHNLLLLIAGSTQQELAAQIQYLKAENEILRARLPKRIRTTAQERIRLAKFGEKLGQAIYELVTIVKPKTFLLWIRDSKKLYSDNYFSCSATITFPVSVGPGVLVSDN